MIENREYYIQNANKELEYCSRVLPTMDNGIEKIRKYIRDGEPFAISRLGETEQRVVHFGLVNDFPVFNPLKKRNILRSSCANWCEGAGFFPKNVNLIPQFTQTYVDAFGGIDLLGVWGQDYEPFLLKNYFANTEIIRAGGLYAVEQKKPWTEELKGMKVLVISPFAKSIELQYERREKIHANPNMLPEFKLSTITAVQSPYINGKSNGFKNWFDALNWMYEETLKIDFDVALLGCGAYALPLASMIKLSGHGAITTCGSTQLLFGIMGSRWDTPEYRKLLGVNEYWVRPSGEEIPMNRRIVENGCYW